MDNLIPKPNLLPIEQPDPVTSIMQKFVGLSIIIGLMIYAYFVGVLLIKINRLNQSLKISTSGNPAPLVMLNLGMILLVLLFAIFTLLI